jgi:hypothetical protein
VELRCHALVAKTRERERGARGTRDVRGCADEVHTVHNGWV